MIYRPKYKPRAVKPVWENICEAGLRHASLAAGLGHASSAAVVSALC